MQSKELGLDIPKNSKTVLPDTIQVLACCRECGFLYASDDLNPVTLLVAWISAMSHGEQVKGHAVSTWDRESQARWQAV